MQSLALKRSDIVCTYLSKKLLKPDSYSFAIKIYFLELNQDKKNIRKQVEY